MKNTFQNFHISVTSPNNHILSFEVSDKELDDIADILRGNIMDLKSMAVGQTAKSGTMVLSLKLDNPLTQEKGKQWVMELMVDDVAKESLKNSGIWGKASREIKDSVEKILKKYSVK